MRVGAVLGLLVFVGCSSGRDEWTEQRPPVFPISGRVLLDGKPLAGAEVNFLSANPPRTAFGVTDASGYFQLTTFEPGDGAVAGPQQVKIRKVEIITHDDPDIDYASSLETAPPPETKWLIPQRYGDYAASGLTFDVQAGGENEPLLELKTP